MTVHTEPCTGGCGKLVPDEGQYGYICQACWQKRKAKQAPKSNPQGAAAEPSEPEPVPACDHGKSFDEFCADCFAGKGLAAAPRTPPRECLVLWEGDGPCPVTLPAAADERDQNRKCRPEYRWVRMVESHGAPAMGARPMKLRTIYTESHGKFDSLLIDSYPIGGGVWQGPREIAKEINHRIKAFEAPGQPGETEKGEG